jgi:hypothetical protein
MEHNPQINLPDHVTTEDKKSKFYLNQIERLNKMNMGPWITKTKKSLIVKLIHLYGKSVAIQIGVPHLKNLPNLMTNFN